MRSPAHISYLLGLPALASFSGLGFFRSCHVGLFAATLFVFLAFRIGPSNYMVSRRTDGSHPIYVTVVCILKASGTAHYTRKPPKY